MDAYDNFMTRCYEESLKWAYATEHEDAGETENATNLEALKPFLPSSIDFESFKDYFHLWKQATNSIDSRLPIPSTKYIIPYHFAKWNKFKGGSDTITKLFWNANHYVPSDKPAAYAVSRLFRFLAAILYRCDAVMTSKQDLASYHSLLGWRRANNTRQTSFSSFLRNMSSSYLSHKEETLNQRVSISSLGYQRRASRSRVRQVEATWASQPTLKTPKKNIAEKYEDVATIDTTVLQRRLACPGHFVFRITVDEDGKAQTEGPGTKGRCAVCKTVTRY